ncbi:serine/threonine-protein kinase [Jannaschia seohaensis]|uniref:Serine/threonine protein kinase n=1 Tax=Jannaschia seohaensis TaxID=475081 RepID=A0A2Y9C8E5_9RHOB|nr:serine/threonine-protein kinase [Jannaschia seohaensis]PWJ16576.1 serine/threonine protein kinase [Jannaschia seohaensis]SSA48813.1 Serine/threonine protein kinase [Jannaschia seohaensis]
MIPSLPSDIFKTGQLLNNTYEVEGLLGRGGTGEVYLARNQITGRQSAIKALNAQFSGNADYLELMKREEQMRDIVHDAVVRYSECSRTDAGHVILVMDYIQGTSLNDMMFGRGLSDRDLLIVAHRVLEGLVATHAKGIVHRDLSPDNIILRDDRPDRATLIDFGIAKDTAAGARTIVGNEFAGKYEFAAPEQLDGRVDSRSDLYALGASLLAAQRRELPQIGGSPGEILRKKREPLDTSGLSEPLKKLIDWLGAVDPGDRPPSAQAALDRLDGWLAPKTDGKGDEKPKRSKLPILLGGAVVALGAVVAVSYAVGLFDRTPPLPHVTPYTLAAAAGGGAPTISGHAPDAEIAAALAGTWQEVTGGAAPEGAFTLATGMPDPDWPAHVSDLMTLAATLDDWTISVSDNTARLTGLAETLAARAALEGALEEWTTLSGMTVTTEVIAGPRSLERAALSPTLAAVSDCGPLSLSGDNFPYSLGDTVTVTGDVAVNGTAQELSARLAPLIGDRSLRIETDTLNPELCAIRAALPDARGAGVSLRLGSGEESSENLAGIYRTGEFVVADLLLPQGLEEAHLWVSVVDNTGLAFHVVPNQNRPETSVGKMGTLEGGLRRIPLLGTLEQLRARPDLGGFALRVDDELYGKAEIVAIVSSEPLFELRPSKESVAAFAEALAAETARRPDTVLSVSSRILDLRE